MFAGKRVMIVDDSHTVRYEVRLILEKLEITMVEVANSIGMLNLIEEYGKCVDLIIMDVTLKYENGLELIEKLKTIDKYKAIPIVVLTQHSAIDYVLKAKELGVNGYLKKPIQKDDLVMRVSSILDKGV